MRTSLSASLLLAALLAAGAARPATAQAQKTPGTAPAVEAEASSEGQGGSGLQTYFAASGEAGQPNQLPPPDAQLPPQLPTPALCRFLLCLCSAAAGTSPLCCVADSTIPMQAKVPPACQDAHCSLPPSHPPVLPGLQPSTPKRRLPPLLSCRCTTSSCQTASRSTCTPTSQVSSGGTQPCRQVAPQALRLLSVLRRLGLPSSA